MSLKKGFGTPGLGKDISVVTIVGNRLLPVCGVIGLQVTGENPGSELE